MTVLEEMLNRFERNLDNKIKTQNQRKKETDNQFSKISHDTKAKTYARIRGEFQQFKSKLLKFTEYQGSDPNYLLMPTNAAAGLYFAKQKRREEDEKMQNLA